MDDGSYEYRIEVSPVAPIAGGRYGFVAAVVDLRRPLADGTVERHATPLGQYHGETAAEAEARAREGVERWIEAQRARPSGRSEPTRGSPPQRAP